MASSFTVQTRQLDRRYNQVVTSTRGHNDDDRQIDARLETKGMYGNHHGEADNLYGVTQDYGAREIDGISHGIGSSDPYSYNRPSYARSSNAYGISSNHRDNPYVSRNVAHQSNVDDDDLQLFQERDRHQPPSAFPYGKDGYSHDNRRSYMNKPYVSHERIHSGGDHHYDDGSYNRNRRSNDVVQPGFQRVQYDVRNEIKPKSHTPTPTMIEVAPGEFLRLRTADETWKAIRNDFYMPCECVLCEITLFCIQDAVLVLCPQCLVVNPLEGAAYEGFDGGVGMGFTMESLAKWQEEIMSNS
jgi:hypothetical protein